MAEPRDGQHDFEFFNGSWKVHNRRLEKPLSGHETWYEFEGRAVARPMWGGKAQVDEYTAESPRGLIQGMTIRLYDPRVRQWSLYWANAQNGRMDVPVVGEFKDGRGEFFDQEMYEGRSIYVRYVWSKIQKVSCQWEQAFSDDGGKTWETNWIMEMTRDR